MGIEQVISAPGSPWQNPFVERLIGTLRSDCLGHVIAVNEHQVRRVVARYLDYCHDWRTHLSLSMDAPNPRIVHLPEQGRVVQFSDIGGLHYHYERLAAQSDPRPLCKQARDELSGGTGTDRRTPASAQATSIRSRCSSSHPVNTSASAGGATQ